MRGTLASTRPIVYGSSLGIASPKVWMTVIVERSVRLREATSGLDVGIDLLDQLAPRHAELLWRIAGEARTHGAIHAIWTGPEISCPVLRDSLPAGDGADDLPLENATSYPARGEIATVFAARGTWKGMPPSDFFDIGLFYGDGARLLMPMGWIMASVCGRVRAGDLPSFVEGCAAIRRRGACELVFSRDPSG